jgi:16S rRNA (cytosine967-C5)-methyltransferase
MLKPGGILVYASCSILPSENQVQVASFLETKSDEFEQIAEQSLLPSEGFDGFYMCRIRRKKTS